MYNTQTNRSLRKPILVCSGFIAVPSVLLLLLLFAMFSANQTAAVRAAPNADQAQAELSKPAFGIFDIMINEIMSSNGGSAADPFDQSQNEDWIELYNPTGQAVNLQGMYISDTLADPVKHQITVSLFIQPMSHLIFWADDEPEQGPTHLPFKLKASGEAVVLYAPNGETEIDAYIFDEQQENVSVGRSPDGGNEWSNFLTATPGKSNKVFPEISNITHNPETPLVLQPVDVTAIITDDAFITGATLFYSTTNTLTFDTSSLMSLPMNLVGASQYRAQIPSLPDNTLVNYYIEATDPSGNIGSGPKKAPAQTKRYLVGYQPPSLKINEIMPSNESTLEDPDELLEFPDWIEIYNFGRFTISLSGMHLSDDPEEPDKYEIPSGVILFPNSYVVFFADDDGTQGPLHTNFKLGNSGEQIGLYGPYGAAPIDVVAFESQPKDTPVGRYPDALGAFGQQVLCATPGEANQLCNNTTLLPLMRR